MITLKNNIIKILLSLCLVVSFTSCDEVEDANIGGTSTEAMAGEWFVQTFVDGNLVVDYMSINTYNTSADDGTSFWINDNKHVYWFKAKTPVNLSDLTFSGSNLPSSVEDDDASTPNVVETYDINVTITNGMITKGDRETSGGNLSDGISFDAEFSDDPGTIYTITGYKRTGFGEDEH